MPEPIVFNPNPDTQKLKFIQDIIEPNSLSVEDLAKQPQSIHLLLQQQASNLYELQELKARYGMLEGNYNESRDTNKRLEIDLARVTERHSNSFLEIPVSIFSGFAINMLTADTKNILGWALFLCSLVLLAFLRREQLGRLYKFVAHEEEK